MKPLILITNDDGIYSPGLHALAEVGLALGDIVICAPLEQQTSMSRAKPRLKNNGVIHEVKLMLSGAFHIGYAVDTTPALCVVHGVQELADRKVDLCLSGINYGENLGYSFTSSGTLGACLEAQAFGIPGIAVSLETPTTLNHTREYEPMDWRASKHFTLQFARRILEKGLPAGVGMLNLNVPLDATEDTPVRWTRHSDLNYYQWFEQDRTRDRSKPYRLRTDKLLEQHFESDSDAYALAVERAVSVTALARNITACDDMTVW
jgi:5'-nucleotidase